MNEPASLILFGAFLAVIVYSIRDGFLFWVLIRRSVGGAPVSIPSAPTIPPVALPPPVTAPPVATHPEISLGDVGTAVEQLQQILGVAVDGEFGPNTDTAVRAYQATHGLDVDGTVGADTWAALLSNKPAVASPSGVAISSDTINKILQLAAGSSLAHHAWTGRGVAPAGYIKGIAVSYANAYAKWKQGASATAVMAAAASGDGSVDALSWYAGAFSALGLSNAAAGSDTLRHTFVLLTGLGMRESSGRYCCGRDMSASNVTADTAEAGLFQQSWNSHSASPELSKLAVQYSANPQGFLSIFSEGVTPQPGDLTNYGSGDGEAFQALCKSCPDFAVEAAAIGLRTIRQHWGPINRQEAELRPEADQLFQQVQAIVDAALAAPTPPPAPATPAPVPAPTGPAWIALGRTFNGLVWHKGQTMPAQIAAWMDHIATTFPEMQGEIQLLKSMGAQDWWAWCGGFVQSMLSYSNIRGPFGPTDTQKWPWAKSWATENWGTLIWMAPGIASPTDPGFGGPISNAKPQIGDVLVWGFGHVSFYDHPEPDTDTFTSLGGDQGTPLRVCIEDIAMSSCIAIRRPPQ